MTDTVEPGQAPAYEPPAIPLVSEGFRRYALVILLLTYTLSLLDRQIVAILAEPIKNELQISDTLLGMLTGMWFGLLYVLLGLPLARMADRVDRVWVIGGSVVVWSAFTILCGRAMTYPMLALARIGVGVGEAGATPTSHALIADYTPKDKRAAALAFYAMGAPLGSFIGMAGGGYIADAFNWRTAFLLAGVPGILLGVVVLLTLKEPRRKMTAAAVAAAAKTKAGFFKTLAYIAKKRTFWLMAGGGGVKTFIAYGQSPFTVSFFLRVHNDEVTQLAAQFGMKPLTFLGIAIGLMLGVFGSLSSYIGGMLADRAARKDLRGYCSIPAIANLVSVPCLIAVFLVPSPVVALALLIPVYTLAFVWNGPVYSTAQGLVPPQMRATSASITLFVINFFGLIMGATIVGALSDYFNHAQGLGVGEGLRWAMVISSSLGIFAAVMFWFARKTIREEMVS